MKFTMGDGKDPVEKVAPAEQTFQHGFSAGGVYLRGLYETRAHEEGRGEERKRVGAANRQREGGREGIVGTLIRIVKY